VKRGVILAVVVLLVIAGGGMFIWKWSEVRNASQATAGPGALGDAALVAEALQKLETDPGSLMASGVEGMVLGEPGQAIAPGASVEVKDETWAPDGIGGGTIEVHIADPTGVSTSYLAVMVEEAGEWKVLATFPIEGMPGE